MANLEPAHGEPERLGRHDVGTEHLLLGLVREGEGSEPRSLSRPGVDRVGVATAVLHMLSGGDPDQREQLRAFLTSELTAVLEESKRLHAEVERLRLLRQHGVRAR
jgi:Clp amino terminal domain, pathogenicity island component